MVCQSGIYVRLPDCIEYAPHSVSSGCQRNVVPSFSRCVLKVTVSDTTHVCRDDHLCAVMKEGIDGAAHRVQSIWEDDLTE